MVLSLDLARDLCAAGLRWQPVRGDQFLVADRGMDDEVFVLSDMTIEVHEYPGGPVIRFNGTTEWALDSLDQRDALWLPHEHQLRDLLGRAFESLTRQPDGFEVRYVVAGRSAVAVGGSAADAYASALLAVLNL